MDRLETRLRSVDPLVREVIARVPPQRPPPSPPEWLRYEMLERHAVLERAEVSAGTTVVEVGSGAHAMATVPLALAVGREGRVVAVERARWDHFRSVVAACGVDSQIRPVAADARWLPLRSDSAELAVCVHGVRSLHGTASAVPVVREMFRVAPRVMIAESLPIARNEAQRAHLAMYALREPVLRAATGRPDDLPYPSLEELGGLVESAGGAVERRETLDVDLPHYLAWFPRSLVESIADPAAREPLLRRWDDADGRIRQHGEDHPPVGLVLARRTERPAGTGRGGI